jgi:protoheme IX farnesyltransferase
VSSPVSPAAAAAARNAARAARPHWQVVLADYVALTKPKVQSLLLLTTVAAMEIAGDPSLGLVAATLAGGYMSAGGAGAINHWFDRDIDAAMERTADRPIPSGRVSARSALVFGVTLEIVALVWLALLVNPLSAAFAFVGFAGYVGIYTIWLKRRSAQNVVIGGIAGAIPPVVGWTAVTNSIDGTTIYLFAILFFWQVPHFWALALLMMDEYAKVNIPMLPVVRGARETRRQILIYTVALYAVSQLVFCGDGFGVFYLVSSLLLGGAFIGLAVRLMVRADRRSALTLYLFSLAYLALLFVAMVVDVRL